MKELVEKLSQEFSDKEYAHAYMESHSVSRIAAQIYALRRQHGWSQKDLAKISGIAQERISLIESGDFESLTMRSLQKFSQAFDVNLFISFSEFSKGILDIANLTSRALEVSPRTEDLLKFNLKQIKFDNNGKWRSVSKDQLMEITTFAPTQAKHQKADLGQWMDVSTTATTANKMVEI